jgi:hypothetical protein
MSKEVLKKSKKSKDVSSFELQKMIKDLQEMKTILEKDKKGI